MLKERLIEYELDGQVFAGFLAWSDSRVPAPGIMIVHAWGGRDEFADDKARALAAQGYTAFAIDLFGKGIRGSGPEENAKLIAPFMEDRGMLQGRLTGNLDLTRSLAEVDPDCVAAIGYCFGGLCVLDLARTGADLRGVISFHGLFTPPGNTAGTQIRSKVLALHGHDDPMVPVEAVTALEQELTDAGADWQIHVYGGTRHGFTNPAANNPDLGTLYNPDAERRAGLTMHNFFEEILQPGH